jgi:ppGpp synthetase/RelA/SpoT-type nucleotidyltranferase
MIKTDIEDLYKSDSGGIINTNNDKLLAYKKQKQHYQKINNMEKRIKRLEMIIEKLIKQIAIEL